MKNIKELTYYPQAKVVCACGNTFTVGSTLGEIQTEICSNCHPFYTGKKNLIDTAGRVERFAKIMAKHKQAADKAKSDKSKKSKTKAEDDSAPGNLARLKEIKKELEAK